MVYQLRKNVGKLDDMLCTMGLNWFQLMARILPEECYKIFLPPQCQSPAIQNYWSEYYFEVHFISIQERVLHIASNCKKVFCFWCGGLIDITTLHYMMCWITWWSHIVAVGSIYFCYNSSCPLPCMQLQNPFPVSQQIFDEEYAVLYLDQGGALVAIRHTPLPIRHLWWVIMTETPFIPAWLIPGRKTPVWNKSNLS